MVNFNEYMNEIDFSGVKKLFLEEGKSIELKKRDYFVRQNEPCKYVGLVQSGIFRYTRIDNDGNEPIVGYSFTEDFVCDYPPIKELEKRLVAKIKSFILELGRGFTFIGNQYRLEYNNKEYFVDMLFFHRGLRSLVAIEFKIGGFKPEYVGKMNMYLSLLDRLERGENENQSIGIILCADKDHLDVEIALQDINKSIGVAEYQLLLPKEELQTLLLDEIKAIEDEAISEDK